MRKWFICNFALGFFISLFALEATAQTPANPGDVKTYLGLNGNLSEEGFAQLKDADPFAQIVSQGGLAVADPPPRKAQAFAKEPPRIKAVRFTAAHVVTSGFIRAVSQTIYTETGFNPADLKALPEDIRAIIACPPGNHYYTDTRGRFGWINEQTRAAEQISFKDALGQISGAADLTYDSTRGEIVVSHGSKVSAYNPSRKRWRIVAKTPKHQVLAEVAYCKESDRFFFLANRSGRPTAKLLMSMTPKGNFEERLEISPPLPLKANFSEAGGTNVQMHCNQDNLYVLFHQPAKPGSADRMYQIDSKTGIALTTPFNTQNIPLVGIWPGMLEGFFLAKNTTGENAVKQDSVPSSLSTPTKQASGPALFEAVYKGRSYGGFNESGPLKHSLQPAPPEVNQIIKGPENGTYYGLTKLDFGLVDLPGRSFSKIEPHGQVEHIGHPLGLVYVADNRSFYISQRGEKIARYHWDSGGWSEIKLPRYSTLEALAYCEDTKLLYGLYEHFGSGGSGINGLLVINLEGVAVSALALTKALPSSRAFRSNRQLRCVRGTLYALVDSHINSKDIGNLYRIDRQNGTISATSYEENKGRKNTLWPGWPSGPPPSRFIGGVCAPSHSPSNYKTPENLLSTQEHELHILSIHHARKLTDEAIKNMGATYVMEASVFGKIKHEYYEASVRVKPSPRPIVLLLSAYSPIYWDIHVEKGARLAEVITIGRYAQQVRVSSRGTKIRNLEHSGSLPSRWEEGGNSSGDFERGILKIRKSLGLRESSFQGCGKGEAFGVPF